MPTDQSAYLEALTPENTTVILIDFATGFGNVTRTKPLGDHLNNVLLLAQTALSYESGLVVTNGPNHKTSGPLYPQLLQVLGNHPVVVRGGMFNAFLFPEFVQAVQATGRHNLVVAGLTTEGCVLQTVLGGLRAGYHVGVVVDTCAGQSTETHTTAIKRMVQAGATPLTAFSLAAEFQVDQSRPNGQKFVQLTTDHNPEMTMNGEFYQDAQADARAQDKVR